MIKNFREQLRTQRWDDHRYYHHSRINQSLHFVSAFSFLVGYALLFVDPVAAALVGWLVSMTTRQAGHFFFEPKATTTSTRRPTITRKRSRSAII
jgi:hypothetical protein